MPPVNKPKQHTKNHHPPKHQHAIIHTLNGRILHHRPHGPKASEKRVNNRNDSDRDAKTAESKGSPGDFGLRGAKALVQHDGCGKDEGRIIACYDEGDEGAETDGGANVDESEEEVDDRCGAD